MQILELLSNLEKLYQGFFKSMRYKIWRHFKFSWTVTKLKHSLNWLSSLPICHCFPHVTYWRRVGPEGNMSIPENHSCVKTMSDDLTVYADHINMS